MKYALFQAALTSLGRFTVTEVVEAPRVVDGTTFSLTELYHPSLVIGMRECSDDTKPGDTYDVISGQYFHTEPEPAEVLVNEPAEVLVNEPAEVLVDAPAEAVASDTGNGEPPPK